MLRHESLWCAILCLFSLCFTHAGLSKDVLTVVLSVALLGTHLTVLQICGYVTTIVGVAMYNRVRSWQRSNTVKLLKTNSSTAWPPQQNSSNGSMEDPVCSLVKSVVNEGTPLIFERGEKAVVLHITASAIP